MAGQTTFLFDTASLVFFGFVYFFLSHSIHLVILGLFVFASLFPLFLCILLPLLSFPFTSSFLSSSASHIRHYYLVLPSSFSGDVTLNILRQNI